MRINGFEDSWQRILSCLTLLALGILIISSGTVSVSAQYPDSGSPIQTSTSSSVPMYTQHYACRFYSSSLSHCDLFRNATNGWQIASLGTPVQKLTTEPQSFVDGVRGKALELKASQMQSLTLKMQRPFDSQRFTVSFWVKQIGETTPNGHIISHTNFGETAGWFFDAYVNANGSEYVRFNVDSGGALISSKPIQISNSSFTYISGVFDGSTVKLYSDGILSSSQEFAGIYQSDPDLPVTIASASYSASDLQWSGIIDEVIFYDNALGNNEEYALYDSYRHPNVQSGTVAPTDGIAAHWAFEGNLIDTSSQSNSATMHDMAASMTFAPDGRLFVGEKNSCSIKILLNGNQIDKPFFTFPYCKVGWEQGLLGVTLDSHFDQNHYVYAFYTHQDPATGSLSNQVVRLTDEDNSGTNMKVIVANLPALSEYDSGGALAFGPTDDKLYISVGDQTEHAFAQDPNILIGKILRVNPDGSIPDDNPIAGSPVYALGLLDPLGIAFDPTGYGIIAVRGESSYDHIDELVKGQDYGFPLTHPANTNPIAQASALENTPLIVYYRSIFPTQAIYYTGDKFPELKGHFVFGTYSGDIYAFGIDKSTHAVSEELLIYQSPRIAEPIIALAQSPGGDIYYGGNSIYKLGPLVGQSKKQDLFPLTLRIPMESKIGGIDISDDRKTLVLNVLRNSSSVPKTSVLDVQVAIPKSLFGNVLSVHDGRYQIPFYKSETSTSSQLAIPYDVRQDNKTFTVAGELVVPEFSNEVSMLSGLAALFVVLVVANHYKRFVGSKTVLGMTMVILVGFAVIANRPQTAEAQSVPITPFTIPGSDPDYSGGATNSHVNGPTIEQVTKSLKEGKNVLKIRILDRYNVKSAQAKYVHNGEIAYATFVIDQADVYKTLIEVQGSSSVIEYQVLDTAGNQADTAFHYPVEKQATSWFDYLIKLISGLFSQSH